MIKTIPTFTATFSIGLQKGYTQTLYTKEEVTTALQEYQDKLIKDKGMYLSARLTTCEVVLSGQIEPHLTFDFINYPKFELPIKTLKEAVLKLAKSLMKTFKQNRVVVVFSDDTIMIEIREEVDPRIVSLDK
mgnify:CR=1 FL=1